MQHAYSTIGLRAEGDLLLWRMAESIEMVEETAADLLASGIGQWLTPAISMIGLTRPSQYVKRADDAGAVALQRRSVQVPGRLPVHEVGRVVSARRPRSGRRSCAAT